MNFLVSFFNDIGTFTYGLITQPFSSMPLINQGADTKAANVLLTIGGAGFLAYLYVIGFIASLSLLGSILLALFIAFFVLAIRWVAIAACIVLAPLAIASYVLPGTQKLWGFWKNTFLSTLIMFPILMALIASGDAMARIATALDGTNAFFIYIMYFAPFFLFSTAFKLAGGVIGGISQLANDKAGGVFSGLKNFRRNSAKRHWGSLADGSRGGRLAQKTIGTAARATTIPDQNLFTRTGRDRFRSASNKLLQDSARKRAEEDRGHSLGDTDETRAAIMANSRKDFLDTMMNKHGYSAKEARKKLARLEAGTHSQMGSNAMKASAMRGQTTLDGGGWWDKDKHQFDHAGYAKAAKHLMDIGVFREEDLGAMLAENAQRGDMNMGTFSERVDYNKLIKDGASIDEIAQRGNASMYRSIKSSQAMTANLRTAEQVSEQGIARIDAALSGDNSQIGTKNVGDGPVLLGGGGMDTVAAEYAQYGNYQEMMGYASSTNREAFAKQLLASPVGALSGEAKQALGDLQQYYAAQGKEMTHQDVLDALRGSGPLVSVGQVDAAGKPVYETTKNGKVKLDASGNPVQKMTTRSLVDSKYIQVYTARHRELSARAVAESGGKFMPNQNPGPPTPP
jgi:hypothetical protein